METTDSRRLCRSSARWRIRKGVRLIAWGLAAAIVYFSVVPPALRPETGLPHDVEHLAIFCATGLAFGLAYNDRRGPLAALLVCFAGAVEVAQLLVPGRHARLSDFLVDALAACIGVMIVPLIERARGSG
jgi:VanZ family protein